MEASSLHDSRKEDHANLRFLMFLTVKDSSVVYLDIGITLLKKIHSNFPCLTFFAF